MSCQATRFIANLTSKLTSNSIPQSRSFATAPPLRRRHRRLRHHDRRHLRPRTKPTTAGAGRRRPPLLKNHRRPPPRRRAFFYTNISLFLSIPNSLLRSISGNRSAAVHLAGKPPPHRPLRSTRQLRTSPQRPNPKHQSNPSRPISQTHKRLVKSDLIATFNALIRQDQFDLALKVFSAVRSEFWYKTELSLYTKLVTAPASSLPRFPFLLVRLLSRPSTKPVRPCDSRNSLVRPSPF